MNKTYRNQQLLSVMVVFSFLSCGAGPKDPSSTDAYRGPNPTNFIWCTVYTGACATFTTNSTTIWRQSSGQIIPVNYQQCADSSVQFMNCPFGTFGDEVTGCAVCYDPSFVSSEHLSALDICNRYCIEISQPNTDRMSCDGRIYVNNNTDAEAAVNTEVGCLGGVGRYHPGF